MSKIVTALAVFTGFALGLRAAPSRVFDVRDAGATADGKTLCTAAIQQTIDRCAAAGGGTVHFPAGTYLSGTIVLKSHVTLHLEAGATLLGSRDPQDYPPQVTAVRSYTDNYVRQALIYGDNVELIALEGAGTIDGNGGAFKWKEYVNRPYAIRLVQCRDIRVEGLTLRDSAMWMQHYLACDRLQVRGLRVFNHISHNNDGIDIDGCHDVTVSDCVFDSDDDAICLKSTLDRACENVTVTNCVLSSHCNAFKLGTESNGGFKNIVLSNCVILSPRFSKKIHGYDRGLSAIALESVDGGHLENIVINNIAISGVNVPLFLRLGNRARPFTENGPKPEVGTFRNVTISDIVATGTGRVGCSITGLPDHFVENVTLARLSLEFEGGGTAAMMGKPVPERADAYPESRMFGDLPAYAIYARHVRGLKISDVRVATLQADVRHALVCDDVRELEVGALSAPVAPRAAAIVRFTDVADALVRDCRLRGEVELFMKLDGKASSRVVLLNNDLTMAQRSVECGADAPTGAWRGAGNLMPR